MTMTETDRYETDDTVRTNICESDDDVRIIGGSGWNPEKDPYGSGTASGDTSHHDEKDRKNRWKMLSMILAALMILAAATFLYRHISYSREFPASRPDKEIVSCLQETMPGKAGITMETDESMGVEMKIYRIDGLKAHFADTIPDLKEPSVYLVTRSADYMIQDDRIKIIGDFIQDGKILSKSRWRAGFMAIADGNAQIGVSRSDIVRRYVLKKEGSFFRQMAIVSAGTRCDSQFILKGKVTRCAYARDESGRLYFIETVNPETLYGFADALIEYGFIDAVYVTGGTQPDLFYRSDDGTPHGTYIDDKPHKLVVWTSAQTAGL